MNTKLIVNPVFAATCLLALIVQTASAAEPPVYRAITVSQTVRFGDLDLSTQVGRKALKARLRAASWQVCSEVAPRVPGLYMENAKCRNAAVNDAVNQVYGEGGKAARLARQGGNQAVLTAVGPKP